MRVDHIPCGEYANDSERGAVEWLTAKLRAASGDQRWILLSNVASSVNPSAIPDEIDLIAIGPTGVFVFETKHWDRQFLKTHAIVVEAEATKLNDKIRRLATKIRKAGVDVGFLAGRFLLTKEEQPWKHNRLVQSGSTFFVKGEWPEIVDLNRGTSLTPQQVELICRAIQPLTAVTLTGQVRRLAHTRNLELISPQAERFHRVFRGEHVRLRDKVILHLFDLSATTEPKPETLASREFDVLHGLQQFRCVPRLLDSFQEVPEYPGELFYFSLVDPCAPTLADRSKDPKWSIAERRRFAARVCKALAELHAFDRGNVAFVHRHLNPTSILVGHQDQPVFTSFHWSRATSSETVANAWKFDTSNAPFLAPEVRTFGLSRSDQRSDVFALCGSLATVFSDQGGPEAEEATLILEEGLADDPDKRPSLAALETQLDEGSSSESKTPLTLPAARYWSEGIGIPFNGQLFRLVSSLGSGSFGTTFKIVQILDGDQEGGSFVGKVVFDQEAGERALKAYRRVRAYTTGSNMAAVFEVGTSWQENSLVALMKWVNGSDSRTEYAVSTLEQCLRKSTIFCRATGRIGRLSGISL
jgi:serine/threonine protein kinase